MSFGIHALKRFVIFTLAAHGAWGRRESAMNAKCKLCRLRSGRQKQFLLVTRIKSVRSVEDIQDMCKLRPTWWKRSADVAPAPMPFQFILNSRVFLAIFSGRRCNCRCLSAFHASNLFNLQPFTADLPLSPKHSERESPSAESPRPVSV